MAALVALPFLGPVSLKPAERPALTAEYLDDCLKAFDIPPSLPAIPLLLERPEVLEELPAAKRRKLNSRPSPHSVSEASPTPTETQNSPKMTTVKPPAVNSLAPLIEKPFEPSQLVAMSKEGLSRGRAQKHAGDAHHRSPAVTDQHQGILELADALLVYVYAFWCDDHLKGRIVDGVVKPNCDKANWQSIFGMLKFTRNIATEAGKGWEAVVGLTNLLEGLILEHLSHHARRQLHNRIDLALKNRDHTHEGHTPVSTGPSPPSVAPQGQTEELDDQIKAFLRLSIDMEAKARHLHAALFARDAPFSHVRFPQLLPALYRRAMQDDTPLTAQVDLRGGSGARWAWPMDLVNGPTALSHAAAFSRAVLEQVAEQQELHGWRGVGLRAPEI